MAEGHDDLRPCRVRAEELDDPGPQRGEGIARQRRDALRVVKRHPRPAHSPGPPVRRFENHYEEVSLVIEGVFPERELRQRLAADGFQELEVLLSPLESLFHRDHPVPEHSGLGHQIPAPAARFTRSPLRRP
jgi:hypothetical protein